MKAVFVFALVLLCCCYAAKQKAPKDLFQRSKLQKNVLGINMKAAARGETEPKIVKVKKVPCSFSAKYNFTNFMPLGIESRDGEFKQYFTHQMDTYHLNGVKEVTYSVIMRTDIQEIGNPFSALITSTGMAGDECVIFDYGYTDDYSDAEMSPVADFFPPPGYEYECDTLEDSTWGGQKCKNCTVSMYGASIFVKDGYIVGADLGNDMTAVVEYKFEDVRKDMIVPNNCQEPGPTPKRDGLPAAVHSAPSEVKDCKTKTENIDLKTLPCTYEVKYTETTPFGTDKEDYKFYGNSGLHIDYGSSTNYLTLVRGDIKNSAGDPLSGLEINAEIDDDGCSVWYCDFVDDATYYLDFMGFGDTLYCDMKNDVTWEGKKCTNCTMILYGMPGSLFVKDGLIIGEEIEESSSPEKIVLEYVFENFRNDVILNETCVDNPDVRGVPIPKAVYSAPPEIKDCSSKPKGNDAASTIGVVASMIISMIMVTLISLF